tara:strand:+ start:145 stop:1398 length:1254 start_codon:yes stop_codon:yes gene_type:complete
MFGKRLSNWLAKKRLISDFKTMIDISWEFDVGVTHLMSSITAFKKHIFLGNYWGYNMTSGLDIFINSEFLFEPRYGKPRGLNSPSFDNIQLRLASHSKVFQEIRPNLSTFSPSGYPVTEYVDTELIDNGLGPLLNELSIVSASLERARSGNKDLAETIDHLHRLTSACLDALLHLRNFRKRHWEVGDDLGIDMFAYEIKSRVKGYKYWYGRGLTESQYQLLESVVLKWELGHQYQDIANILTNLDIDGRSIGLDADWGVERIRKFMEINSIGDSLFIPIEKIKIQNIGGVAHAGHPFYGDLTWTINELIRMENSIGAYIEASHREGPTALENNSGIPSPPRSYLDILKIRIARKWGVNKSEVLTKFAEELGVSITHPDWDPWFFCNRLDIRQRIGRLDLEDLLRDEFHNLASCKQRT